MRGFVLFTLLIPGAGLAQTASSTPPESEQIVVTATRVATPVQQVSSGVTVIDRATIEQFGYTDLVQALADVPGLRVAQTGGPGAQASVFLRGTNSNQVLVLRDGVPVNDPGTPGGAFNFGDDLLNDVERIEIVRGPMGGTYGSGAIGGVINLITRPPADGARGDVEVAGGSQGSVLLRGHVAGRVDGLDYSAVLESNVTSGFSEWPKRIAGYTGVTDGDRQRSGSLELGYAVDAVTRVFAQIRGRDGVAGYYENFDADNAHAFGDTATIRAGVTTDQFDGVWHSAVVFARLWDWRHYVVTLDPADPTQTSEHDHYTGTRNDVQWNNVIRIADFGPVTGAALTAGYEHAEDGADTRINSSAYGFPYVSTVRASDSYDGGYAGAQGRLWDRVTVNGQAREDATSQSGDAFTWRTGAVLALPEISGRIRASYGTGFRAPALYDLYGVDSYGYHGNPDLRAEHSRGYEIGIEEDAALSGATLTLGAAYFDTRLHNLIEVTYDAAGSTPVNVAQARAKGVEVTADLHIAPWLATQANYTYTDARGVDGARLARRPYDTASVRMVITPLPATVARVTIAPELVYTGSFIDYLTNDQNIGIGDGLSPSGAIVNVNLAWQMREHLQLFAWGRNLTASRFEPVNGYQGPGRSVLAGIKAGF